MPAVLVAIVLAACSTPEPHVARGEPVTTGNMAYDDFFNAVRDLRSEALQVPKDEPAPHAKLSTLLGVDAASPVSQTVQASGARAHKLLQERGVQLHLELVPEARLLATKGKGDPGADTEALIKAVEDAARGSLDMRRRYETLAARAADLEKRRLNLRDEAPQAFHDTPTAQRAEVMAELDAAAAVLSASGDAANRSAGAASSFVVDLAQAVETGAVAALEGSRLARGGRKAPPVAALPAPALPPVAVATAPPKPAAKPAPASGAPPKKKKPKGGDDFEP